MKVKPAEELKALSSQNGASLIEKSFADFMDERDPLKDFRSEFNIPTLGSLSDQAPGLNPFPFSPFQLKQ